MTSVGTSTSSSYASTYAQILANAQARSQAASTGSTTTGSGSSSATSVTLSDAAKAALAGKDLATVIADVRSKLDALLAKAKATSPLADGQLAIDLSSLDRRELWAMASNSGQGFGVDEQKAAQIELTNRFDHSLAGATSVGRVTGKLDQLYAAALAFYDAAGPEERATAGYADARKAIEQMVAALKTDPGTLPGSLANDPVNDYMQRLAAGETGELRDIAAVGSDARATLDAQYAAGGSQPDLAEFDSRSLAAIAINTGSDFSADEVRAAKSEMRSRTGAAVLAALKQSDAADPAAFAQNVISLYGAMSSEERAAAGWSDNLYAAAVASYQSASKMTSLLGASTGLSLWGSADTGSNDSSGQSMSLLSYM